MSNNRSLALIRLGHCLAISKYLQHNGAATGGYFRRQGLPALCTDPDRYVPLSRAWGLFNDAALREDQWAGWNTSQYLGDHNLNAGLLKKLEDSPTLFKALYQFVRLIRVEASQLELGIRDAPGGILFFTRYSGMREEPGYHISQSYQLGIFIDLIRHFAGRSWQPPAIGIEASEIPLPLHERFPKSQVNINQPFGYITVPRNCLCLQLRLHHEESDAEHPLTNTKGLNEAQTLSLLLDSYLFEGYPSLRFAASLMETSTRTLSRRLAACGKSYQVVVDEVRFRKAKELLQNPDILVSDVAGSVGFSDQAHFSRMFSRIGGISPRGYRKVALGRDGLNDGMPSHN